MMASLPLKPERFLTARGCLDLLWTTWENCPLTPPIRTLLNSTSSRLPAIPRVGLELRLGTGEMRVDMHQLVTKSGGDHLAALGQSPDGGVGDRLRAFLAAWREEGSQFAKVFERFFIEYDLAEAGAPRRLPCLFFDVHRRSEDREERLTGEALIVEAIEQLQGALTPLRRNQLEKCFHAVNGRGSIGHLGIMLGRDEQPIRLNIKDLRRGALLPLLDELGWAGDRTAAESAFHRLIDEVDLVTVALDLGDEWLPGIGFEAFLKAQPEVDPRWQRLLRWLCDQGLCTENECQSLLQFPGVTIPGPSSSRWPASWLVAASLAPPDSLPVFRRELSHIKVTLNAAGERSAKAYLATRHEWLFPTAIVGRTSWSAADLPVSPIRAKARIFTAALEAAEDFLLSRFSQGHFWRDFHLDIGYSDEWVTAFVASQMALTERPRGLAAARAALGWLLRRQRATGGWGYNAISPPDADSTAWVLRLANACGMETEASRRARAFLANHLRPDGAVTTYSSATPLHFRNRNWSDSAAAGWRGAHGCVTANAAALLDARALDALRRSQTESGAWRAYWWRTDVFATALAVESLLAVAGADNQSSIERAISWAAAHDPNEEASAFDLAWQLRLARFAGSANRRDVALRTERLLDLQDADGGWPTGAPMLFPPPSAIARPSDAPVYIDQERNFTTASVLAALALAAVQPKSESQAAA